MISKDMKLMEVIGKYPETAKVLLEHGLHCIGCHASADESLEQGCLAHGLNEEDIDKIVEEMNELIKEKKEDSE